LRAVFLTGMCRKRKAYMMYCGKIILGFKRGIGAPDFKVYPLKYNGE